jgi:membrane associated rhomboid family serine protease
LATYTIVIANVLVHFLVSGHTNFIIPDGIARTFGFDPASFGNLSAIPTLVTSMFLHGDLIHLFGNMIFLVVFGRRVENQAGENRLSGVLFNDRDQRLSRSHAHGTEFFFTSYRRPRSDQRRLGNILHL